MFVIGVQVIDLIQHHTYDDAFIICVQTWRKKNKKHILNPAATTNIILN